MTDAPLIGVFVLPKRFIRHMRLFTDLDIRTYVYLLGELLPNRSGIIDLKSVSQAFEIKELIVKRSLLRLMAFGLIRVTPNTGSTIQRIEIYSDSIDGKSVSSASQTTDWASKIAEAMGDNSHLSSYQYLVDTVAPEVIRRALNDTLAFPVERIRKSRPALFFALTRKYAASTTSFSN